MKILLLTRYSQRGASSRLRTFQYVQYLQNNGIEVTQAPLFDDSYLERLYSGRRVWSDLLRAYIARLARLLKSEKFDLVWVEKEIFPWFPAWFETLTSTPMVVDYDDATFHRYDRHSSPAVRTILGRKIDRVMAKAALVIAGNNYLAERAIAAGAKNVSIIPTVVDLKRYSVERCNEDKDFTIGWIGTPVTSRYLNSIRSALESVCAEGRTRLVLVGADERALDGLPGEIRQWSELNEVAELKSIDVGIMPLPDEPWERGKCGYKLIQYMACGKPVVASPVGVNKEIVNHQNGFLASTDKEWQEALRALRSNRLARESMGDAGRQLVEKHYNLDVTSPILLEALVQVVQ